MEYWKEQELLKKKRIELKQKYPELGKIVKFSGEVGVVVIDPNDTEWELAVRWDTKDENDYEQFGFFDYEYLDSYDFKYINLDGTLKNI
jgi:uncharacterized alpha/beta hydrolase family protein